MPKLVRRALAILAGVGFTLFILALPLLESRHPESLDQLPEQARGPQPSLPGAMES